MVALGAVIQSPRAFPSGAPARFASRSKSSEDCSQKVLMGWEAVILAHFPLTGVQSLATPHAQGGGKCRPAMFWEEGESRSWSSLCRIRSCGFLGLVSLGHLLCVPVP